MELKLRKWNVNLTKGKAFNRTILELKHEQYWEETVWEDAFNRTILELKLALKPACTFTKVAFNRTILELKPIQSC